MYLGRQASTNTLDERAASIFWSTLYDTSVSILCISYCNRNNYQSTTQYPFSIVTYKKYVWGGNNNYLNG